MDNDTLTTIAEKICQLWRACGGYGPPHEFKVVEWGRGTTKIQGLGLQNYPSGWFWGNSCQASVGTPYSSSACSFAYSRVSWR